MRLLAIVLLPLFASMLVVSGCAQGEAARKHAREVAAEEAGPPYPYAIWVRGHWAWRGRWVWMPGHWRY